VADGLRPIAPFVGGRVGALDLELLTGLNRIQAERAWVTHALDRLRQFLDLSASRYRLPCRIKPD
jgi:hypothetical protein